MGLASFTSRLLGHGAAAEFVAAAVSATSTVPSEHIHKHAISHIEEIFCHVLHVASKFVNFFGGLILIGGIILSAFNTGLSILNMANWKCTMLLGKKAANLRMVRFQLGEITALALEILVVSDILETLVKVETSEYSFQDLGKIFMVATLRTTLAYFLGKEVDELEEKIFEGEHAHGKSK